MGVVGVSERRGEVVAMEQLAEGQRVVVHCGNCDLALTLPVVLLADGTPSPKYAKQVRVKRGLAVRDRVRRWDERRREFEELLLSVNIDDVRHLELVEDWKGCCGPTGDVPNMRCLCTLLRAAKCEDCWVDHCVQFAAADVVLRVW